MSFETTLKIGVDARGAQTGAQQAGRAIKGVGTDAESASRVAVSAFAKLRTAIFSLRGAIGAIGLVALGRAVLNTAREFETLRVQLQTVTGSAASAAVQFERIKEFARTTPFEVENIVRAFNTLAAQGIDPTTDRLSAFGDTAAAFGRDITDIASAVVGAITGETERLKAFGIIARVEGDKMRLTFRGVTREVNRDAEGIVTALEEIGRTQFAGGMVAQSKTASGALSNMADSTSEFFDAIARDTGLLDGFTATVKSLTQAITELRIQFFPTDLERLAEIEAGLFRGVVGPTGGPRGGTRPTLGPQPSEEAATVARRFGPGGRRPGAPELGVASIRPTVTDREGVLELITFANLNREQIEIQKDLEEAALARDKAEREEIETLKKMGGLFQELDERRRAGIKTTEETITGIGEENELLRAQLSGSTDAVIQMERVTEARKILNDLVKTHVIKDQATLLLQIVDELEIRDDLIEKIADQTAAQEALEKAAAESAAKQEKALEDQAREAERRAEEMNRPFVQAAENIQSAFSDAFANIFSGGIDGFKDFADQLKNIFARLLAELATLAIRNAIIVPIVGQVSGMMGIGGSASQSLLGNLGGGSGTPSLGGLGGGFSGSIDSFASNFGFSEFGGGVTSGFDSGGFISAGGSFGPEGSSLFGATTGSQFLGGVGAGFGAGMLTNSVLGGNTTGGTIGSGIGAVGGAAIGSIFGPGGTMIGGMIGGALGGAIGGLFGGGEAKPTTGARVGLSDGRLNLGPAWAQNDGDVGAANTLANAVVDSINRFAEITGTDLSGSLGTSSIGTRGDRFWTNLSGQGEKFFATAEAAVNNMVQNILEQAASFDDPTLNKVLSRSLALTGGNLEETAGDIELAKLFLGTADNFDDAINTVVDSLETMRDRVLKLGLTVEQVEEGLVRLREDAVEALVGGLQALRGALDLLPIAPNSPMDRFEIVQERFFDVVARARDGEIDAIAELPAIAGQFLDIARDVFASGPAFVEAFNQVRDILDEIIGAAVDAVAQVTTEGLSEVSAPTVQQAEVIIQQATVSIERDSGDGGDGRNESDTESDPRSGSPNNPGFALGGLITGASGIDNIMTPTTAGEFVIRKSTVDSIGIPVLDALNSGRSFGGAGVENVRLLSRLVNETVAIRKQQEGQARETTRLNKLLSRRVGA